MHLHHICLASSDPENLADFYASALQMEKSIVGEGVICCEGPDRLLLFVRGEDRSLQFGAYVLDSQKQLLAMRQALADASINIETNPSHLFKNDKAFAVRDPDGNKIIFSANESAGRGNKGLKARLQHLVVASDNPEDLILFYTRFLNFKVTDRVLDKGGVLTACFLRSNEEHHSFAIFRANEKRLDHHCYEAGDWNLIRDWCDSFSRHEILTQWGPGRHGPGKNLFVMIHDPDGNWIEISAELETVSVDHQVGEFEHSERTLNLWGKGLLRA